ncbi:uncharacterized protein LOC126903046 [Daktulosphaira vitifoliae]|uniref:uncharacterized protein LOC126903046 n=1 Tax=Daktulosphaira vitifoliae TaxID=58002 RepID=UPI0021AABA63|nr:uncharacterized protein LOC126903046 [Daktulosphaira vitifoliae]
MEFHRWQTTWWCILSLTAIIVSATVGIASKGMLKMLKLDVPSWVDYKDSATLNCHYDTGGDRLYSVKWYKDDNEFFRYTPELSPNTMVYDLDGVHVDKEKSSANSIILFPLTRNSNGIYKCEVSTDAPNFPTVFEESNLTVIALPINGPRIVGIREWYNIGEYLEGNCTAKMTYPKAVVNWFINGLEVDNYLLEHYQPEESDGPFYNITVGLRYPLKKEWVDMNKKTIDVKCTAKIAGADIMVDETKIGLRLATDHTLSQERHIYNSGTMNTSYWIILLAVLISCCLKSYY